ncbi:DUF1707 domain-containing protein [Actinoallomurus purpureus]|uniref:DUF1707 SHOCT-like domain-containing protein n=1 Tax=Actinoallomurus purpureus TaxID=478114 RepID=UPI002092BD2C|nr:DUF1707 domain-containing protein [Actinoallomurus purpureus]MCO6006644.1 DUF1707 domain-containing protein [Actinoallomurus purpureus]
MELPWRPNDEHVPARDLRASDADRERVVALLRDAHGDGRLTVDEHAERVEGAYTARTLGELSALTADLTTAEQQPIQVEDRPMLALFGTVRRGGRWVVPVRLPVSALFGTVEIDLREALLQRRHVVVRAAMLAGRLRLVVPEGVRVEFTGRSVLGAQDLRVRVPYGADAPVVEVSGVIVLGSVNARTPKRRRRWGVARRRS